MTDPDAYQRAKSIVDQVTPLPEAGRQTRVRELCGGDSTLLDLVEDLLRCQQQNEKAPLLGSPSDAVDETIPAIRTPVARDHRAADPMLGRRLANYELLSVIGSGGMGVVYRARQLSANRDVALKVIRMGVHASAEQVLRFRTEAESAANLDHPGIVPVYEVGSDSGNHFFSMRLVEGQSLAQ